jgi:ribonucleoside-diphosphate reductase alpha chain
MNTWESDTTLFKTNCGKFYITQVYDDNGRHSNVLISGMGKAGGCSSAWSQAIGRLITLAFEKGASYMEVAEQLKDIRCPEPFRDKGELFTSCIDAIAGIYEEKREEASDVQNKADVATSRAN